MSWAVLIMVADQYDAHDQTIATRWIGNALRFATREQAESYALSLYSRWTLVREWKVEESKDDVNVGRRVT